MNNKIFRYLIIAAAIAILIFLAVSIYRARKPTPSVSQQPSPPTTEATSQTRLEVPKNITVPDSNQTTTAPDIAKPVSVSPATPQGDRSLRKFEIRAEENKFKPKEIIAYEKDIVQIKVTAVDKDYDWVQPDYGFNVKIAKGTTKTIEFQVTTVGKYVFYCEACGGLNSTAVGYVTVVPKK
mgnify:CR=1 FL=1